MGTAAAALINAVAFKNWRRPSILLLGPSVFGASSISMINLENYRSGLDLLKEITLANPYD